MSPRPPKPGLYAVQGGVLSLSGPNLKEFLDAVLAKGAAFRFRARGFSMHPFIQDGDVVIVSPLHGSLLSLGEVVACCQPLSERLIVHRILRKQAPGFFLRGDNCLAADGLIPASRICGRVTQVERNGRILRLGWGPERVVIGLLSRWQLLQPLVKLASGLLRPFLLKRLL